MDRTTLETYNQDHYGVDAEYPWTVYPHYAVFRHLGQKKWFAVTMRLSRATLGLPGEGTVDVVNLKCDPLIVPTLTGEAGFLPAYHMSKVHWITVLLDGTVDDAQLKWLLEESYALTKPKKKRTARQGSTGQENIESAHQGIS